MGYNPPANSTSLWSKKHDLSLDYFGTARVRFGMPQGGILPYITGGAAWAKTSGDLAVAYYQNPANAPYGISGASVDEYHFGWTIGGGLEVALGSGWSIKAEYLHVDLGKEEYLFKGQIFSIANPNNNAAAGSPFNDDSFASDLTLDTVQVGINYKLSSN